MLSFYIQTTPPQNPIELRVPYRRRSVSFVQHPTPCYYYVLVYRYCSYLYSVRARPPFLYSTPRHSCIMKPAKVTITTHRTTRTSRRHTHPAGAKSNSRGFPPTRKNATKPATGAPCTKHTLQTEPTKLTAPFIKSRKHQERNSSPAAPSPITATSLA